MRWIGLFVSAALGAWALPAHAQEQTSPQALTDVYACAATSDDTARLTCYDAAVGRLRAADQAGRVVAVDREQVATLERESFGFSLPALSSLLPRRSPDERVEIESLEMMVTRVVRRADGKHHFLMDNGQVWTQVEAQPAFNVDPGDRISIRRAALGAFMLSPEDGLAHRVRRTQ